LNNYGLITAHAAAIYKLTLTILASQAGGAAENTYKTFSHY